MFERTNDDLGYRRVLAQTQKGDINMGSRSGHGRADRQVSTVKVVEVVGVLREVGVV